MTIDERLDRLTERHEALAQSVEILRDTVHEQSAITAEQGRNIEKLFATVAEQGRNIEKQGANMQLNDFRIEKLLIIVAELANHAGDHAERLKRLEDAR